MQKNNEICISETQKMSVWTPRAAVTLLLYITIILYTDITAVYMFPYVHIIYCTVYLCDIFFAGVNYYFIAVM